MTADLDRILSSDMPLQPAPMFAAEVMRRVWHEAAIPKPIPFPWWRLVAGVMLILCVAALNAGMPLASLAGLEAEWRQVSQWWNSTVIATGLIWLLLGVPLSYISVRLTLRTAT